MIFENALRFPAQYGKRQSGIARLDVKIADVQDTEDQLIIGGLSKSSKSQYAQRIEIQKIDNIFNKQCSIQILCSCESFKYEFAGALLRNKALLETEFFEYAIKMHKPKKKNINQVVSGCKHVIALANIIWKNKTLKNFGLVQNVQNQRQYMMANMKVSMDNFNPRDPHQIANRQKMLIKQREQKRLGNLIK